MKRFLKEVSIVLIFVREYQKFSMLMLTTAKESETTVRLRI